MQTGAVQIKDIKNIGIKQTLGGNREVNCVAHKYIYQAKMHTNQ